MIGLQKVILFSYSHGKALYSPFYWNKNKVKHTNFTTLFLKKQFLRIFLKTCTKLYFHVDFLVNDVYEP